ncbi:MAG: hypothetical protein Q7W05_10655 [Deltaproteobacteria bacterium]|nr:hypothetical protein [Deltaproteobacteria bacterium]
MTMEYFMDNLRPCPKCGEQHDIRLVRIKKLLSKVSYRVCCDHCGRTGLQVAAPQEALNCWNFTRASSMSNF